MTDKIVRGLAYREDGAFIDPPYKVECFLAAEDRAKQVKELLDKHGKVLKREPAL